jgi:hypothetical protein
MILDSPLTDKELEKRYLHQMAILQLFREHAETLNLPLPTRVIGILEVECTRSGPYGHFSLKCLVGGPRGIGVMRYHERRDENSQANDITWHEEAA